MIYEKSPWTRKRRPRKWDPYIYRNAKPGRSPRHEQEQEASRLPPVHVVWAEYTDDPNVNR